MDLHAAVKGIVDQLAEDGIRAVVDARDVNTPSVLVRPPELDFEFKAGGFTATWELWLIVADTGRYTALRAVSELIDEVQASLGWKAVSARPSDTQLPDVAWAPMYILTFKERIHP